MSEWIELSEKGYWVFPTRNRQKYPTTFSNRSWDTFIEANDQELLHAHLLHEAGTGAALCPQATDKVPLLILDLDTYGMEFDDLWKHICPGEEVQDELIVGSPSGGFHIWFKLPDSIDAEKLPATFDFGEGITGEVRASSKARRLIMLPGSLAVNKNGKPAKYKILRGNLKPDELPHPPPSLMARLVARKDQGKADEGKQPTEVMHLIGLLEQVETVTEGDRNNFIARPILAMKLLRSPSVTV